MAGESPEEPVAARLSGADRGAVVRSLTTAEEGAVDFVDAESACRCPEPLSVIRCRQGRLRLQGGLHVLQI